MPDEPATDVARIAHDREAFASFYRRHVDVVQRFIARRVDDPYQVADLTADVFLAVIESASTYRKSRGEPIGWLYGVARNVVAASRRSNARGRAATHRIAGRALVDDDDVARIVERVDAESSRRQLYQAMDQLSDAERAVLELVALDRLSVHDAAVALGVRPSTARVRLHRARRRMQRRLGATTTQELTPSEVVR